MQTSIDVCETAMAEMHQALVPGITENALWSILHQKNIELGGEWIETRLLSSGERTQPWFRECSMRLIAAGDLVSFDTDLFIKELEKALQQLEIAQRKAKTFFTTKVSKSLKDSVNHTFKENNYTFSSSYNKGIMPDDCREQLRQWAETLAIKEAEKTPEGKKVKQLELYKQSAVNEVFEISGFTMIFKILKTLEEAKANF